MRSLADIYVDYVDSLKEPYVPREGRLFVTDVGKCHRAVAYRLLGTEKNPKAESTITATSMMFDLADYIEQKLTDALRDDEMLIGMQGGINIHDHENWGGRYDIAADYDGLRIIEVKTVRSNAFNYDLPKMEHAKQAAIYHHYLYEELELEEPPMLWYADRGGSNPPREYVVDYSGLWPEIAEEMDQLDAMREALPELPPRLPKTLNIRSYGKQIKQEQDHRCGYCDYSDVCKPDGGTSVWAILEDGVWMAKKAANMDELVKFAHACTQCEVGEF